MSNNLGLKRLNSIAKIKSFLDDNVEFKIGKTDDLERRERQHKSEGYTNLNVIAECTTLEEVDKLETDLKPSLSTTIQLVKTRMMVVEIHLKARNTTFI